MVSRAIRKFLKPCKCYDDDKNPLEHDWGSIFLLEDTTIIRVFGCPEPPLFLPKYVLERLGICEFFFKLTIMNR